MRSHISPFFGLQLCCDLFDASHQPSQSPANFLPWVTTHLKGASPVPGPTMMMGLAASSGSRKSGFLCMYTGILSPT